MSKVKDFDYLSGKKYDGMMGRCYRASDRSYKNYGERGIKVCSAWIADISVFRAWIREELVLKKISEEDFLVNSNKIQLDRIDPDGHYGPDNCRLQWSQLNHRNRRKVREKVITSAEGDEYSFVHGFLRKTD